MTSITMPTEEIHTGAVVIRTKRRKDMTGDETSGGMCESQESGVSCLKGQRCWFFKLATGGAVRGPACVNREITCVFLARP